MSLLHVSDVRAGYGAGSVLHGVSLRAEAGEIVAVLGPNGAGKSTLLRAISGVVPDVSGHIALDEQPLHSMPAHKRVRCGVVHVPEGRGNVMPALTVADNLRLCGGSSAGIEELFPMLRERREQVAGTLSGGQQQMLAIALGLSLRPRVLLVDEPSAGLAPGLVDEVFARLAALRGGGIALVVAEQRVDLAVEVADRGYVVESGRISVTGTMQELRNSTVLRESYLGA